MDRPVSIVRFARCYLAAIVVGIVNQIANWSAIQAIPAVRQSDALIGAWYPVAAAIVSELIPLALWYFVARRRSVVAKWIVVVLFAIGVLGMIASVARSSYPSSLDAVLSVVAIVLEAVAVWLLFRPDAMLWLGERGALPLEEEPIR